MRVHVADPGVGRRGWKWRGGGCCGHLCLSLKRVYVAVGGRPVLLQNILQQRCGRPSGLRSGPVYSGHRLGRTPRLGWARAGLVALWMVLLVPGPILLWRRSRLNTVDCNDNGPVSQISYGLGSPSLCDPIRQTGDRVIQCSPMRVQCRACPERRQRVCECFCCNALIN